jgi:hypothetical protein
MSKDVMIHQKASKWYKLSVRYPNVFTYKNFDHEQNSKLESIFILHLEIPKNSHQLQNILIYRVNI